MDTHSYYEYKVLEHLEDSPYLTNRMASAKLGVSVKLTHAVLSKMIKKGWIHATERDGRSLFYFLTPEGISEKVRLTYEFLTFTQQFYKEARKLSSEICQKLALSGTRHVALLGSGDLAEIVFLSTCEHGLRITNVYDTENIGNSFMNLPVQSSDSIAQKDKAKFEKILVGLYDAKKPMRSKYLPEFVWVFDGEKMAREIEKKIPSPE
ncbi:MAG: winged helix-turn-helix transcriptional regulator [Planctomycetota bacterium]|jgi:DNA-binding MarR family transcriptional regulator